MKFFLSILGDLLFPGHCCSCGNLVSGEDLFLCESCRLALERSPGDCIRCGSPKEGDLCLFCEERFFYPARNISPFKYTGVAKDVMRAYKFHGQKRLAGVLANLLEKEIEEELKICDFITCVPMRRAKVRARGFNQSEEIARILSKSSGKPFIDALQELQGRSKQKEMTFDYRFFNAIGRFYLKKGVKMKGKSVLIIDDVFTTGATLNECARILLEGGAKSVFSSTICRSQIKMLDK